MTDENTLPEFLTENDDGSTTITLTRERQLSTGATTTVKMRETTAGDMVDAQKSSKTGGEKEIVAYANLCELTHDDICSLTLRDYSRLQVAFSFMSG